MSTRFPPVFCLLLPPLKQVLAWIFLVFSPILYAQTKVQEMPETQSSKQEWQPAQNFYSRYGKPLYGTGFKHFNYVNPDFEGKINPQRQQLKLSSIGNGFFNTFNPFVLKGNAAPNIDLLFESLMTGSSDEEDVMYGLLAKNIIISRDYLKIRFELNENARFSNQKPVLSDDVLATFNTLMQEGTPSFKILFKGVSIKKITPLLFEFQLSKPNPDMPALLASLSIFSRDWLIDIKKNKKKFEASQFIMPIASGPYTIKNFAPGKFIEYQKNNQYWASKHPTRLGMYHFQTIRFDSFQEDLSKLEAFKAGAFDALVEYRAKSWAKSYQGKAFDSGRLLKRQFQHQNPTGVQGFAMNLRKPLFQNQLNRQALAMVLNFDWMNQQLFFNQYQRINSYFTNSIFSSQGLSNTRLLHSNIDLNSNVTHHMSQQNKNVLKQRWAENMTFRENLKTAQNLLQKAGWRYDTHEQILKHPKYGRFEFTFLDGSNSAMQRVVTSYADTLKRLGIRLNYQMSDPALIQKRLNQFDYDMVTNSYGNGILPGPELWQRFSSETANIEGSENLIGLQDPKIDAMLKKVLNAKDKNELMTATKILDQHLLNQYYMVFHWFSNQHRIAYARDLKQPSQLPRYYSAHDWMISTWWRSN